jgi:aryl-alcohol dehydrogenase-like predicted oxidoreductase
MLIYPAELQCTVAQLALAWLAINPNTSSVIIGASTVAQLEENLGALDVLPKLTPALLEKIDTILQNTPSVPVCHRFPLKPLWLALIGCAEHIRTAAA